MKRIVLALAGFTFLVFSQAYAAEDENMQDMKMEGMNHMEDMNMKNTKDDAKDEDKNMSKDK